MRDVNAIVITTIFPPTEAVRAFAQLPDCELIIVGDQKTPPDWSLDGVTYLSPAAQDALGLEISRHLPWNHYGRKMVGYVYAISRGARIIVDTDDDNVPKASWSLPEFRDELEVLEGEGFVNVYRHFSDAYVWPRGFPLRALRKADTVVTTPNRRVDIGVWQFLADGDPDVDAIYRLVFDNPVIFGDRPGLALASGVVCPFNSQNTFFSQPAFPLLYLPSFVTFRFTDILRSLVAQPLLWASGLHLAFGGATVRQARNPHDYLADFADEVPMYLQSEAAVEAVTSVVTRDRSQADNLRAAYEALAEQSIVEPRECALLDAWLADLAAVRS